MKWTFIGYTPAHGKIYEKGDSQLVIYSNGVKRLWPNWPKERYAISPSRVRDKQGMIRN